MEISRWRQPPDHRQNNHAPRRGAEASRLCHPPTCRFITTSSLAPRIVRPLSPSHGVNGCTPTSGGVLRNVEGVPEAIGGVADHLHWLIGLRATVCLAGVVRDVKVIPLGA